MDVRRVAGEKPSATDVMSWLAMKSQDKWSRFWGTLAFGFKARLYGIERRGKVRVWGPIHLMRYPKSRIVLGDGVDIISSSKRGMYASIKAPTWLRTTTYDGVIEIGDRVGMSGTSILCRSTHVRVGEGTMIAANVTISDTDAHAMWPPDTRRENPAIEDDRPVEIGSNVWLGVGCTVLKGVTIGDNSVIGAMSVVTRDVPPGVVATGVPARTVRELDAEQDPARVSEDGEGDA